ncbi:MAG: hypothetical protein ACYCX4_01425 [Bacillota bacterium]
MNVPIEVNDSMSLPDVSITFYLSRMLTTEQEQYIKGIIIGWYDVGVHGGFGGYFHFMHDIIFDDEQTIYLSMDMGSAPSDALDVLYTIVNHVLTMYDLLLEKIKLE